MFLHGLIEGSVQTASAETVYLGFTGFVKSKSRAPQVDTTARGLCVNQNYGRTMVDYELLGHYETNQQVESFTHVTPTGFKRLETTIFYSHCEAILQKYPSKQTL